MLLNAYEAFIMLLSYLNVKVIDLDAKAKGSVKERKANDMILSIVRKLEGKLNVKFDFNDIDFNFRNYVEITRKKAMANPLAKRFIKINFGTSRRSSKIILDIPGIPKETKDYCIKDIERADAILSGL